MEGRSVNLRQHRLLPVGPLEDSCGIFRNRRFNCPNTSLDSLEKHEVAIIGVTDTYVKQVWRLLISDVNEADSSSSDYKIDSPIMTARGERKCPLS